MCPPFIQNERRFGDETLMITNGIFTLFSLIKQSGILHTDTISFRKSSESPLRQQDSLFRVRRSSAHN